MPLLVSRDIYFYEHLTIKKKKWNIIIVEQNKSRKPMEKCKSGKKHKNSRDWYMFIFCTIPFKYFQKRKAK